MIEDLGKSTRSRLTGKLKLRQLARAMQVAVLPSETLYVAALRKIMSALHEALVKALLHRRGLRTDSEEDEEDEDWDAYNPVVAAIVVHFLVQIPHLVRQAFDRMAPVLVKATDTAGPNIDAELAAARDRNIRLVERAGRVYAADVRKVIDDPANASLHPNALRELLVERGRVSLSRADMIARDQVLKLAGTLAKLKQQHAGIKDYVWSGCLDERERPSHLALEGRRFTWGEPTPIGYEPGHDYQCRCVAVPWVPELDQ